MKEIALNYPPELFIPVDPNPEELPNAEHEHVEISRLFPDIGPILQSSSSSASATLCSS
jgi:hypothetical protein